MTKNDTRELGVSALSKVIGVSRQSVYAAERTGRISREASGKFDVAKVKAAWDRQAPKIDNFARRAAKTKHVDHEEQPTEHPLLSAFAWTWCESLGALALLLRDKAEISSEKTIEILSLAFLLQWRIIGAPLNHGWEDPLRLDEPLIWLSTKEGKQELQDWLDAQPVCWDTKEPSRVRTVNAKQAAGFTS